MLLLVYTVITVLSLQKAKVAGFATIFKKKVSTVSLKNSAFEFRGG